MAIAPEHTPAPSYLDHELSFEDTVFFLNALQERFACVGDPSEFTHPDAKFMTADLRAHLDKYDASTNEPLPYTGSQSYIIAEAVMHLARPGSDSLHHLKARQMLGEDVKHELAYANQGMETLPVPVGIGFAIEESMTQTPPKKRVFESHSFIKHLARHGVRVELEGFGDANAALVALEEFKPPLHSRVAALVVHHELNSLVHESITPPAVFGGRRAKVLRYVLEKAAERGKKPLDTVAQHLVHDNIVAT